MKFLVIFLSTALLGVAADFSSTQAARLVIGQTSFTAQETGASEVLLGGVGGLAYVNDMLFVTDANRIGATPVNNRVLIYKNLSQQLPQPTDAITQGDRTQAANDVNQAERCPVCVGTANTVLGQSDFISSNSAKTRTGMRLPTGIATDGKYVAVADTENNRVLIWNNIPTSNGAAADVVLGQTSFTTNTTSRPPTAKTLRGPQGVWLQDGKLFVADTQNHRVLIWNTIPTSNGVAADLVLGQANFTSAVEPELSWDYALSKSNVTTSADNLLNPVSVTSDGERLYVADLGHNRVLIWNSIPTKNTTAADVVIGQPNFTTAVANYSYAADYVDDRSTSDESDDRQVFKSMLCDSIGTDKYSHPLFPPRCGKTLSFPRYALSDGERLFIADGGNDRVLIYNNVPTTNAIAADMVLGQVDMQADDVSDSTDSEAVASADTLRTPLSLAWDGVNLYVSDPYNRRIMVFTVGDTVLPYTAVRNSASLFNHAQATVTISGTVSVDDTITVQITFDEDGDGDTTTKDNDSYTGDYYTDNKFYTYTIKTGDTTAKIVDGLLDLINAGTGDPNVMASANETYSQLVLTARTYGAQGNKIGLTVTTSSSAKITATASGSNLSGGGNPGKIAPGTLVTVLGENLSDNTVSADTDATTLPTELGGVHVYFDGIRAPLKYVSPTQITAQMPWEFDDRTSVSAYVRTEHTDGTVTATTATGVPLPSVGANPGVFAEDGTDPRAGIVMHGSDYATGAVSVDGSAVAGDIANVIIEDRTYSYTIQSGDTVEGIRDKLIELINNDPKVLAYKAGLFARIRLQARVAGEEGNGITYSVSTSVTGTSSGSASIVLTALTTSMCCANEAYSLVTELNPAQPGETIIVYATGLGAVKPTATQEAIVTGSAFTGEYYNTPIESVSALAGAKTANVLYAGLKAGSIGIYEVHLQLNSDLPTNPSTRATIAQDVYVSNIVTFPVVNTSAPSSF